MLADGKTILLVEDSRIDEMNVRRAFDRVGIDNPLVVARTGEEALALLNPDTASGGFHLPGLMLLDLNMPVMNGHEFLEEVKKDRLLRKIPVIVLTSSDEERDVRRAFENGAAGYFLKPVDFSDFVENIQSIALYWSKTMLP